MRGNLASNIGLQPTSFPTQSGGAFPFRRLAPVRLLGRTVSPHGPDSTDVVLCSESVISALSFTSFLKGESSYSVKSVISGFPWTLACYVGLVEFVIFSTNILVTHIASLFSNSLASWNDLSTQILFFFIMIPILQTFFHFVIRIFISFFRQLFNVAQRSRNFSTDDRLARVLQISLYVLITLGLLSSLVLALLVFLRPSIMSFRVFLSCTGMAFAILCAISPVLAFFRIQCSTWFAFAGGGPFVYPRESWVSPFDMAGLLTDDTVIEFFHGQASPLRALSRRREHWSVLDKLSLIASVLCFAVFLAYTVLDIQRERSRGEDERQRKIRGDTCFNDICEVLCGRLQCPDACAKKYSACPPGDPTDFCLKNCTPGESPHFTSLGDGVRNTDIGIRLLFHLIRLPMILTLQWSLFFV
jgi:hypothetical protein